MVVVPKEKPIIQNLNSYYLNLDRMLEHCQGEFGSGGIHLRSAAAEGVIFFDQNDLLNGVFREKEEELTGKAAIERILEVAPERNFVVDIYEIDPEKIYFWANMWAAEEVFGELSTEFTDLGGLIKKMASENLTGYIDVSLNNGAEEGFVFFNNGEVMGGSYSWSQGDFNHSKESLMRLIQKSKEVGGNIRVNQISSERKVIEAKPQERMSKHPPNVIPALEELLGILEGEITSNRKIKQDFRTMLKKKFVEKVDRYYFLDPFADEFDYSDKKIRFSGTIGANALANGVIECAKELADEADVLSQIQGKLIVWSEKYANELSGVKLPF